jgi:peptidoglycan-associated lipoprotein
MIVRRFVVLVMAASALVAACGGDPPPPPPPTINQDSLEQARQDSIRAAEEAAREAAAREAARQAAREEAARARAVAAARATLEEMVFFDYDMSEIRPDAAAVLRRKADVLRASPQVQLMIEGHADERGSTEYNLALGNRRAEAIREALTGYGLSAARFNITSYGEERPLASGSNESAWARNRRGQFVITAGADAINPPN